MMNKVTFDEEQISQLFGHEAAENEVPDRLRQYYFKSQTFDQVTADLPLRVLVGHKGIGKSALFQIAIHEDRQANDLPVEVRPDDVEGIAADSTNLLQQIAAWKEGLRQIVQQKVLDNFDIDGGPLAVSAARVGGKILAFLAETLKPLLEERANLEPTKKAVLQSFLGKAAHRCLHGRPGPRLERPSRGHFPYFSFAKRGARPFSR